MKHLLLLAAVSTVSSAAMAQTFSFGTFNTAGGNADSGPRGNIDIIPGDFHFLPAGTYTASGFQFTLSGAGDAQPFLAIVTSGTAGSGGVVYQAIASGTDYVEAAAGTYSGLAFGPSSTFVVPAGGETVYGGVSEASNTISFSGGGPDDHFNDSSNATGFANGNVQPGTSTDTPSNPSLGRNYDFGFTVTSAVPEPSTWLAAGGLLLLAAGDFRRRLKV